MKHLLHALADVFDRWQHLSSGDEPDVERTACAIARGSAAPDVTAIAEITRSICSMNLIAAELVCVLAADVYRLLDGAADAAFVLTLEGEICFWNGRPSAYLAILVPTF